MINTQFVSFRSLHTLLIDNDLLENDEESGDKAVQEEKKEKIKRVLKNFKEENYDNDIPYAFVEVNFF